MTDWIGWLVGWLVGRSDVKNLGFYGLLAGWMDGLFR